MFVSKLPNVGTNIFTVMSALAQQHQAINLSQGFPNYPCSPHLVSLVNKYMNMGYNQYAPMQGVPLLNERIAHKINTLYGTNIHPTAEITITAGGTQAIFTAITACVHTGDEVIIVEPAYDCYKPAIELCGGIPMVYELKAPDFRIHWDAFATLVTPRTRLIIINTPHNPTGTVLEAADWEALNRIVRHTNTLVLSDEVYEHLVLEGEHQTILRYPDLYQRSFVIYSFGKTFHTTGWKIGYCVAPPALTTEFRKVHQFNVFSVNTPIQHALAEYMTDAQVYLDLPQFFVQKRNLFNQAMAHSQFQIRPSKGTYFQLADYSHISNEDDITFAKRLTTQYGVAAVPISVFYSAPNTQRFVRFCFAKTDETLNQATELLCKI